VGWASIDQAIPGKSQSLRSALAVRRGHLEPLLKGVWGWMETTGRAPMSTRQPLGAREKTSCEGEWELRELVFGLHWDPPGEESSAPVADLDAICAVVGQKGDLLEIVHPGHPRNANGSIVHTGDARTGTSEWDDERVFIFLEALPAAASKLVLAVSSANGISFEYIPGAQCHVSDRLSETPQVRIDLTALHGQTLHVAAIVCRDVDGWRVEPGASMDEAATLAELRLRLRRSKE